MHRLIRVCIVHKSYKGPFCVLHIICVCGVLMMKSHYNILSIHLICNSASFNVTGCSCAMKQICQFLQKIHSAISNLCSLVWAFFFIYIYFTVSTDSVHGHHRPWSDCGNINIISKICLFKYNYIENFTSKNWKVSDKKHIYAQNIDCGYSLELPYPGSSNKYPQPMFWAEIRKLMHTPVKSSFTI